MKICRKPGILLVALVAASGGASAQEGMSSLNALGGARAYSGHDIEIGGSRFQLRGVTCADPDTEKGKRAKALANTFLRMKGRMKCEASDGVGDCLHLSSSGIRRFSEVMLKTNLCWTDAT